MKKLTEITEHQNSVLQIKDPMVLEFLGLNPGDCISELPIFTICILAAISANAQFKFKSLDNNDGKTTIVIVDDNFKSGSERCCAKFNNYGKTYDTKSIYYF